MHSMQTVHLLARLPAAVSGNEPTLTPPHSPPPGKHAAAGPEREPEIYPMTFGSFLGCNSHGDVGFQKL